MSGSSSGEVHVLMPAHNSARYIEKAVQSALAQSYQPLRVVVYNDGSGDSTSDILCRLSDSAPGRVHCTRGVATRGVAHARNELIAISERLNPQASFLWLDSDDHFLGDGCVEKIMTQMRRTSAEICLYDFEIHWEEMGAATRLSSAVVLDEKVLHGFVLGQIADAPDETVSIETCPHLLTGISAEWVKAYTGAARKRWPRAVEGLLYEDNPSVAVLLEAQRITAVNEPMVNYIRRSGSITGNSMPHHFLRDRPMQLRRFMEYVDRSSPAKLRAATGFVEAKLKRAGRMLDQLVEARQPGFDNDVREEFKRIRQGLVSESRGMRAEADRPFLHQAKP